MKMKIKKISLLLVILICCLFLCGCSEEKKESNVKTDITGTTTVKKTIVPDDFDMNGTGKLKCSTEASAGEGIDVDLNYEINYKKGNILNLKSIQKVISNDSASLDLYETSYANIAKGYKSLKYYDTNIVRDSNSVTYTIYIDYDKIDVDGLLSIEGAEDNIIKRGKAKLSLWLDLAGKMGTLCEEV